MANRIREIRVAQGVTMRELGDRIGAHFTTIAKLERSQRAVSLDWIEKIAAALNVQPADLIGETSAPRMAKVRMVPLIGRIAAGNWREAIEEPMGWVPAPTGGPKSFGLAPDGDSMNMVFVDGAYVIVDPDQAALLDGKIYAILNGEGETTVKRFRADPARLEPESDNPVHKPILLGSEPFQVIGRVIWQVTST